MALQLGRRAGLAADNARLYDEQLMIADTLQRSLLPPALPDIPGLESAARYSPMGDGVEVGGDFYDLFAAGASCVAVIGDVCGKGVEAAALTSLRATASARSPATSPSRALALDRLNEAIVAERGLEHRFSTVAYARSRHPRPGVAATVASAGHPLPLVIRAGAGSRRWGGRARSSGPFPEVRVHDDEAELASGDALVLYTDGVIEARREGEMFGEERLRSLLSRARRGRRRARSRAPSSRPSSPSTAGRWRTTSRSSWCGWTDAPTPRPRLALVRRRRRRGARVPHARPHRRDRELRALVAGPLRLLVVHDDGLGMRFGGDHPTDARRHRLAVALCREAGLLDRPASRSSPRPARWTTRSWRACSRRPSSGPSTATSDAPVLAAEPEARQWGIGGDNNAYAGHARRLGASLRRLRRGRAAPSRAGRARAALVPAGGAHHGLGRARPRASASTTRPPSRCAPCWTPGLERVAYVDLDVHHGNGTQWIFYDEPRVLTVSVHESGRHLFPGSGFPAETGGAEAPGSSGERRPAALRGRRRLPRGLGPGRRARGARLRAGRDRGPVRG